MEEQTIKIDSKPPQNNSTNYIVWIIVAVVVIVIIGVVVGVLVSKTGGNEYLTYDNYMKIKNGMSYSQVCAVLGGHSGTLDTTSSYGGYTMSIYMWSNSSGTKCIVVTFDNGAVSAKSQYGL